MFCFRARELLVWSDHHLPYAYGQLNSETMHVRGRHGRRRRALNVCLLSGRSAREGKSIHRGFAGILRGGGRAVSTDEKTDHLFLRAEYSSNPLDFLGCGVLCKSSRRAKPSTCVSNHDSAGFRKRRSQEHFGRAFGPTPGRLSISSIVCGTSPRIFPR